MRSVFRRLGNWRQANGLWALALVAALSLIAAGTEFVILVQRESQLVDRFSDSTWWMAAQFRSEIQQMHISLAQFDGSRDSMDYVHERYDILVSRIALMDESKLDPKPDAVLGEAIRDVRLGSEQLGPEIEALKLGGSVPHRMIAIELPQIERDAGRMTSLGAQADAAHREAVRSAIRRANVAFGIALTMLIGSLLLSLRAVDRQAAGLDAARRRSEALGAELTVALAQAQAGSRAKNVFLATMSHEIRTPMNGVLGAASLLVHTQLNDLQRRWVAIIKACGEALLAQLDDVLDFSAFEAASVRLEREVFEVRALAEDAARVVESAAGAAGLDLVVAVDPDVPIELISDRRRLGQVLLNLLTNAVKFTPSGGVVLRLSLRRRRGALWLRAAVIDSGSGIPRADRRRIFQEFTRLERPSERTVRGTGLGLAISQRIAVALGGYIRVTAAQGNGSVFWISVPVEVPHGALVVPLPAPRGRAMVSGGTAAVNEGVARLLATEGYALVNVPSGPVDLLLAHTRTPAPGVTAARRLAFGPGSTLDAPVTADRLRASLSGQVLQSRTSAPPPLVGRALRLLVADDDAINREIAASLLRHLGHDVEVAADGQEALSAVRASTFDAVLVDLYMPAMDGIEFARAVRALPPPLATLRLIAVTADAEANIRASVLAAGIDSVLIKPVTLERLAEALVPLSSVAAPRREVANGTVLDLRVREMLVSRLPEGRLPVLVRTFWDGMLRALELPDGLADGGLDRRLHTLAGSAGSLGYLAVTAASRRAREQVLHGDSEPAEMAELYAELEAALRADEALLAPRFVALVLGRLAEAKAQLAPPQSQARRSESVGGLS